VRGLAVVAFVEVVRENLPVECTIHL
jgi:hypothetical protein